MPLAASRIARPSQTHSVPLSRKPYPVLPAPPAPQFQRRNSRQIPCLRKSRYTRPADTCYMAWQAYSCMRPATTRAYVPTALSGMATWVLADGVVVAWLNVDRATAADAVAQSWH